jgi:DNA-binding transcriptional regulator PaaX
MAKFLNSNKPKTIIQWLIFLAAIGFVLSSPVGGRGFFRELNKYLNKQIKTKNKKSEIFIKSTKVSQALYYLKKRKFIEIKEKNGKTFFLLTENGKKRKLQYDLENIQIYKPAVWDRKWRMLMFDIPEFQKINREALRNKLKQMGFFPFQKSVWVYPYACEDEIDFIAENFSIAQYLSLLTVQINNDKPLRKHFNL